MLSYQHIFHAGNHADILKHCVLLQVLNSLNKKEKPYTFFDTHAASGLYDLKDNRSLKTGEAEKGIIGFSEKSEKSQTSQTPQIPQAFADYMNFAQKYLDDSLYPGSPEIEGHLMRKQDTLILSELHPQEIENLRANMKRSGDTQPEVQIHNRNGWEMLKALTPPVTKRGGVLIDPSYEESSDYQLAADTICAVHKKWSNGIILLWYPLLAHRESEINAMLNQITESARSQNPNIEIADLRLEVFDKQEHKEVSLEDFRAAEGKNPPQLYGSGMLVINTPWKLKEEVEAALVYVKKRLSGQARQ